ncbi:little elongation complex subunit 2 isoform X1 [Falco peregrinus]|uniref:little elongation complex subunit 2 isoform X1 n=2 Tax=Falco peregrinus TaxID=8954 RepID=UPI002479D238|nr:little elongation complex subunit 2 isoform X1 [Falco peregrinus]
MAGRGQLLTWDISPKNGIEVFFSHEIYEKYSLAPSLSELWRLSNREAKKNVEALADTSENRQTCSMQAVDPVEVEAKSTTDDDPFPEPRVPYPFTSCLTEKEQKTYLYLMTKYSKKRNHFQVNAASQRELFTYLQMKEVVNNETAEFMKFAQNAAKSCAQDYDAISEDALRYTEELLRACIGHVQKYPEFYTLQEITSIMGGKFHTQLTFRLEKNLLVMGTARRGKTAFPTMPVQLPTDYKTVTSIITPEEKASIMHNDISSDSNAEKLALKYCPQVVLSNQSLFTLLNNHGLNYKEQWEIPVCIKMMPVAGSKPAKVVYVDSPLLRKEMTVRERNQIFHDIPMDFLATKASYVLISNVLMDKPAEDSLFQWDMSSDTYQCRKIPPPNDTGMDFDDDVTELETFGATVKLSKTSKMESTFPTVSNTAKVLSQDLKMGKKNTSTISGGDEEGKNTISGASACASMQLPSLDGILCFSSEENSSHKSLNSEEVGLNEAQHVMTKEVLDNETKLSMLSNAVSYKRESDATQKNETYASLCSSDTDEERLIIDTECKNTDCCKRTVPNTVSHTSAETARSLSPTHIPLASMTDCTDTVDQGNNASRKPTRKLSKEFDPVGQILKMQTELLKSPSHKAHEQPVVSCDGSSATPAHVHQSPKLLVTSSTETVPAAASNPSSSSRNTWTSLFQGMSKRKLPNELQMLEEDPSEYKAPQDGNLVYKLFSLNDLSLLVRCSVQKVKSLPRYHKKKKTQKITPMFLLPKLEYQAYYGVEALTESEVCQLWTESMLHSECLFYIGRIDAFTSKLIMLEKISPEILTEKLGMIKPANSLNILHHILKKVSDLQEGSYLLTHAAGDSSVAIYKSSLDKTTRASYNLHKAHCDLPTVPATLSVPWVPLDPSLPLPYHMNHGRVPCTFPPAPQEAMWKQKITSCTLVSARREFRHIGKKEAGLVRSCWWQEEQLCLSPVQMWPLSLAEWQAVEGSSWKMTGAKGRSDTPSEGNPVAMETKGNPAKPVRNEGVATKKLKKNYCKQRMMKKNWKRKYNKMQLK